MKQNYSFRFTTRRSSVPQPVAIRLLILIAILLISSLLTGQTTVTLNTPANSWTVPAGVTAIDVRAWGAGGAGGGCTSGGNSGAGGGAGGYVSRNSIAVTPGQLINFSIGVGGAGTTGNGAAGSNTAIPVFGIGANGGNGGANNGGAAGTGGTSFGGTINTPGGNGLAGSGGSGGNGGNSPTGGIGGAGGNNANGSPGGIPGGGGGGGDKNNVFSTNRNGGNGGNGRILITYILPTITSFPAGGCQGSSIIITGTNFTNATSVTFNGTASSFTILSPTQISAVVPLTATTGPINVTIPGGFAITGSNFTVNAPPAISPITGSSTVCVGSLTTLSNATAGGTWSTSNNAIANVSSGGVVTGVGNGTVTITYTVSIAGCTSATTFNLSVDPLPILAGPSSVCVGNTIQLLPNSGGTWLSNDTTVASIDNNGNVTGLTLGTTTFTFTNTVTGCSATSSLFSVNAPPVITLQPVISQTVCSGSPVSFSVGTTGAGLTYQWFKGAAPLTDGGNIFGSASSTLTLSPVALSDAAADYYCVINGACAPAATSNNAALIVNEQVVITGQPIATQTKCVGETATFSISATGSGLIYQWYNSSGIVANGGTISGATTSVLTINPVSGGNASTYYCIVSGIAPCNPVTSNSSILVVTQAPAIVSQPVATQTVCDGDPVSLSVVGSGGSLSYQWYNGSTPIVDGGNISGSNTDTLNFVPATPTDSGIYHCVISNACTINAVSADAEVIVNLKPMISAQSVAICSGDSFIVNPIDGIPTAATIVPAGTTYSWAAPVVTGGITGGSANSGQPFISESLVNPTNTTQTATYTVFPISGTAGSCPGSPFTITVTVNPQPFIINQTPSICSDDVFNYVPANGGGNIIPAGTTYSWGAPIVSGGMTGGNAQSGQSAISQTLNNPTNAVQTATYNVTATSGSCVGSTFTVTITVNPKPNVSGAFATQTVCSGTAISPIIISNPNNVPGTTTYNWTRNNTLNLTGMPSAGIGNISGTMVNNTNVQQTAIFTLYATSEEGCVSIPSTVTVNVDPMPLPTASPSSQTVCSNLPIGTITFGTSNNVSGTTFLWTRDNTANLTGIASNGNGSNISGTLVNNTGIVQTTTFTLVGNANGCTSSSTFTITVNPSPTVSATPLTQTLCGGSAIAAISISNPNSVAGTTFTWTRNNTVNVTGIPTSGSGASISGTLINNTNTNQTVIFTITANAAGCISVPTTVDIIVMPSPTIVAIPTTQNHCNTTAVTAINLTNPNNIAGTVFTWTRDNNVNITGLPSSGSGNSINGTLTNNTATNQTTIFTITASAPNGCSTTATASVTMYPTLTAPVISASQTVCALSSPSALTITTPPTGGSGTYTYQWYSSINDGVTYNPIAGATGASYQPGNIPFGGDNTFYQLVVTNPCGSVTSNAVFIEVVNNIGFTFNVDDGVNGPICPNATFTPNISSLHLSTSAVRFTWNANPAYITPATGGPVGTTSGAFLFIRTSTANIGPLTAQNNTNATVVTPVMVTPQVYNFPGPPSGAFICSVTPQVFNITIRPRPIAVLSAANSTICSGTSAAITATGNITDATMSFTWVRNNTVNVTGGASGTSGAIAAGGSFVINNVLNNTTTLAQNVTYTVTPVSNGCTGTPVTITITVAPLINPGTIGTNQTICSGGDPAAFTQLTSATGATLTYQWQSSTLSATGPWTDIAGATATTYDAPAGLAQTTWFIRVVTSTLNGVTCSSATTTPVRITINTINPGAVTGDQTICSDGDPAIFGSTAATGTAITYQWQSNTTGCGGPWTNIGGATAATYNPPAGLLQTTYYRRTAISTLNGVSCPDYSNCIVVNVNLVTGGTVGNDQTLCGNNPAAFTELAASTGDGVLSYQWQSNTIGCGGPWTNISGAIAATYDAPSGLAATTYYRRITTSTINGVSCTANSNCITVTANSVTGGVINGNRTVCTGGDPAAFTVTVPSTGTNLTYQWQSSTIGGAGPWTDIPGATSDTYDPTGPITQIMYYQRIAFATVNGSTCQAASNFITVFINDVNASTISGDQTLCGLQDPSAFTVVTPASGMGTLTYQWQSSTTGCAGPWTNIIGANSAVYDPPIIAQTTYYQLVATSTINGSPCSATSNCVTLISNAKTWNGTVNSNWNTSGNWTPAGVPTSSHCVVIPNVITDPVISGSGYVALAYNLTILNGGRLDVTPTNSLQVTDMVTVNPLGNFFILNNASLVQVNNVTNVGNIVMTRITPPMYRFDFTYWNSPVDAGSYTLGNLSPNTLYDKYFSWVPTVSGGNGTWVNETASTIMLPTKGYIVRAPQTFSPNPAITQPYTAVFIGRPNNGDIQIPIAIGSQPAAIAFDKMNLIGNPFPSAVSADAFLGDPANVPLLDGTIYFWTHHTPPSAAFPNPFYGTYMLNYSPNGYATYNAVGGTSTVPSGFGGTPPNGFIASGQGFFAKGLSNGNAIFRNSMRVTGNNNIFFRTQNQFVSAAEEIEKHRIWLNLADNGNAFSQILIGYVEGATNGIDRSFDGEYMNYGAAFYSVNSERNLTIQGRALPFDVMDQVPLGYTSASDTNFTIGIDNLDGLLSNQEIYLEDKQLNVIHDLRLNPYSFNTAAGTFNERFVLRYNNTFLGVGQIDSSIGILAYISGENLHVNSESEMDSIKVFDVTGKLIETFIPNGGVKQFAGKFPFAKGVYILKVSCENITETIKVVNGN